MHSSPVYAKISQGNLIVRSTFRQQLDHRRMRWGTRKKRLTRPKRESAMIWSDNILPENIFYFRLIRRKRSGSSCFFQFKRSARATSTFVLEDTNLLRFMCTLNHLILNNEKKYILLINFVPFFYLRAKSRKKSQFSVIF